MFSRRPARSTRRPRSRPLVAESLESRSMMAPLAVALCSCSDTGVKGDGITGAIAPKFTGTATPRATVTLSLEGGQALGRARTNARGAWSFVSPRNRIPDGPQTIRVTTRDSAGLETQASTAVTFDRQRPTASIAFTGIDSFRITFDRPVTGLTSALRGVYFSGRPVGDRPFNLPFTSGTLRRFVGRVEFTPSADGRVYDVRMPELPIASGTYTVRLSASLSRVVDSVTANPLLRDAVSDVYTVA